MAETTPATERDAVYAVATEVLLNIDRAINGLADLGMPDTAGRLWELRGYVAARLDKRVLVVAASSDREGGR